MDKYQKAILNKCNFSINNNASVELDAGTLIIKQCENAYITKFRLVVSSIAIEAVSINDNNLVLENNELNIDIDFDNIIIKNLILISKGGVAEPISLKVKYIISDKDAYDEKIKKMRAEEYKNNSNACLIQNVFGSPFVIFNPCCKEYAYTEVEFIATNAQGNTYKIFPVVHQYANGVSTLREQDQESNFEIVLERKRNKPGCNYIMFEPIGRCGLKAHVYQYDGNGKLLIDYEIQ